MTDLLLSNNRITVFLKKKKNSSHSKHMRAFPISRDRSILNIGSNTFWLKDFVSTNLKTFLKDNF